MTDDDKRAIEKFAQHGGSGLVRQDAINAHRRYLRDTKKRDWNIHMKFMSEIDTPCPDYSLRAMYRKQLLDQLIGTQ